MERVRKPTTLPTTLIAWGAAVLAAPALDAPGARAEQVVRIPIAGQLRLLRAAVRAVSEADNPQFRV